MYFYMSVITFHNINELKEVFIVSWLLDQKSEDLAVSSD